MDEKIERPNLNVIPGSPIYVGERDPTETAFSLIGYDSSRAWLKSADTVEELLAAKNSPLGDLNPPGGLKPPIVWINVNGLKDSAAITRLAEHYGIHPLTVEDILDTGQRPKVEEFDNYLFFILKDLHSREGPELVSEQISLVLLENTVITFQEAAGDPFDGIRRRILNNGGRVRKMGADYLAYGLVDSVVDAYFLVLDDMGAKIEDFENRAMDEKDGAFMPDIQKVKQALLRIRRVVWPLRESLSLLPQLNPAFIHEDLGPFIKDLHDNVIQVVETVETYRELIAGVMEVNLSAVSNRLNQVMKVLAIISTLFIPLTFIVGVYGMNFTHMPELDYPYAYPLTWAAMILIAGGMVLFFKHRRWF
ncbi:MAG: magnesium/cobalt transporter CorA [Spirochaetaceae bacterium]|jgi:magnesium transporter|nr:magnesium/cobalt transporter CorA [Spirochaetaceae bacterium]